MLVFWLILGVSVFGGAFVFYLYALTLNSKVVQRAFGGKDFYARWSLEALESETHALMAHDRRSCRDFNLLVLRKLRLDIKRLRLSWYSGPAVLAVFYCLYGLTWCKCRLFAGKNDLRALIGLQLLLLR